MGNSSVFMAGLIMVSTFGCNSGLILSGGRLFYAMAKDGLFFKQATILNKNQVPAKHYGYNVLGLVCFVFLVSWRLVNVCNICVFTLLHFNDLWGIYIKKREPNAERPYRAWLSVCAGTVHNSDYCNLYYIISIRHFKYRFGTGNCSLGNTVYYFLMDNKRIVKVLHWATSFNSPCFNCNLCRE
jgi:APA family basic amino acid/polyamine antiporter